MNAELKAKWTEALRSGKYKQGRHSLRTNEDEFCCLGVLCDVMGVPWIRGSTPDDRAWWWGAGDSATTGVLNRAIKARAGIENQWPFVNLNDDGKTFAEIADYIEAKVPVSSAVSSPKE